MDREEAKSAMEAILFVADGPVPIKDFYSVLDGLKKEEIEPIIEELRGAYAGRGTEIVEIAGGLQMRTRPEYGKWIKKFHKLSRSTRLSQASLETLSIIAYKQPITRQEIENIRGVDSSGPVKTLLDKSLVKSMGRKKMPGKPMTFGTTGKFLEYFGLVKLSDLPTLKDFAEEPEPAQEAIDFDNSSGSLTTEEGKLPEDTLMDEETALVEPAEEDYANGEEISNGGVETEDANGKDSDDEKAASNAGSEKKSSTA